MTLQISLQLPFNLEEYTHVTYCWTEPGHSVGALPERAVPRRQQAGSDHTLPGAVGRQEGVDQGGVG